MRLLQGSGCHWSAILLGICAIAIIFLLHPILGVGDADGFAYLIGAYSLQTGRGYVDLNLIPLNHWPPGYSLLLSVFPDVVPAAKAINYVSLGSAAGLLYFLLRKSAWSWQSAAGLTCALSSGFFRLLAKSAHADMLTYALFLVGVALLTGPKLGRVRPLLWAVLIPIKLIAVVFLPSEIGASVLSSPKNAYKILQRYWPAVSATGLAVAGLLLFNKISIHSFISPSMQTSSIESLSDNLRIFGLTIPREFSFGWYGSASNGWPLVAFLVCNCLAAICLCSLRARQDRDGKWLLHFGVLILVCSAALLFIRTYTPSVRLVGYGLIVLFFSVRPAKWADKVWLLYGGVSLLVAVINAMTVNSMGSMDPRYAALAREVRQLGLNRGVIATNSFHILDLNEHIPSVPVYSYGEASGYDQYLLVTLPKYDPVATAVTPIAAPDSGWCEESKVDGGIVYGHCDRSGQTKDPPP